MKDKTGNNWIPFWIDKWIFGSTRHELSPEERSIWADFLALSGKDNGYIRANEITPYPYSQLAGLLCVPEELITRTIDKCIQVGKLRLTEQGTLYVCNYEEFRLSDRSFYRAKKKLAENTATMSAKPATPRQNTARDKIILDKIILDNTNIGAKAPAPVVAIPKVEKPARVYPTPGRPIAEYDCQDLLGHFGNKYKKQYEFVYPANFGKDLKIFKDMLARHNNPRIVLDLINIFFERATDETIKDNWLKGKVSVGMLKTKESELLIQLREEINSD